MEERGGPERDAETVVFCGALGVGRWVWRWPREALRGEFDIVSVDLRGTGRSASGLPAVSHRPPDRIGRSLAGRFGFTVADLAADVEAVLADAGVRTAHLVGADLGGMVALELARESNRVESQVLVGTSHGGTDAAAVDADVLATIVSPDGRDERERARQRLRATFTPEFLTGNPHLFDRLVEWSLERDVDAHARRAQASALEAFDVSDDLDRIRVPTLVLHGTGDRLVPPVNARLLAETLPVARRVDVAGGHCIQVEAADAVIEEVLAFLESSGADAPRTRSTA